MDHAAAVYLCRTVRRRRAGPHRGVASRTDGTGPDGHGRAALSYPGAAVPTQRSGHRRRNEVERTMNRLKSSCAVTTRYDERPYVFHGTVTAAAIRLWLRP